MEKEKILVNLEVLGDDFTEDEAFASVNLNPTVTWAKFILTDDQPNGNKQRIQQSEFTNLITTGVFMPIKVAEGAIAEGHKNATPLGVISHLKTVKNQVYGLAALWNKERPDEIKAIKKKHANKEALQLSWEVTYADSSLDEDGITDLKDVSLWGVTLVGMPAYKGRTPIIALAEEQTNSEVILEKQIEKLEGTIEELKLQLAEKDSVIKELEPLKVTVAELQSFKDEVVAEKEAVAKLATVKEKFTGALLEKDDEYFETNKELLLGMNEGSLDFMIQEMVSFAGKVTSESDEESVASIVIPKIQGTPVKKLTPKELAEQLREVSKS